MIGHMNSSFWVVKERLQAHARIMQYLLLFDGNNGHKNATHCYVMCSLPLIPTYDIENTILSDRLIKFS
jgi:hypothetical protein